MDRFLQPKYLCFDMEDYIWIASEGNKLQKFATNVDGTITGEALLTITDVLNPIAFDVTKNNELLLVCDFTTQQIKAYLNSTGEHVWTRLEEGGYANSPVVSTNKVYWRFRGSVACQDDGSYWVTDEENFRVLHFAENGDFIEFLSYIPASYDCRVNRTDSSMMTSDYVRIAVDRSKEPSDPAYWRLTHNYRKSLPSIYASASFSRFQNLMTMSNGRVYAFIRREGGDKHFHWVELTDNGVRLTNLTFPGNVSTYGGVAVDIDGNFIRHPRTPPGGSARCYMRPLTGYTAEGNPIWGTEVAIYNIPNVPDKEALSYGPVEDPSQKTSSGLYITFEPGTGRQNKHLGAVKPDENRLLWSTSKSTHGSYIGPFPDDGTFDEGNRVVSSKAGRMVLANGTDIFWNYQGENWKTVQTNWWHHFHECGLMVGQFGTDRTIAGEIAGIGMSGNVMSGGLSRIGDKLEIIHCDEGSHGAIHQWDVEGLDSIEIFNIPITLNYSGSGLLGQYYSEKGINTSKFVQEKIDSIIDFTDLPALGSATWSGFFNPEADGIHTFYVQAEGAVKLFINDGYSDIAVINRPDNAALTELSGTIELKTGKSFKIILEVDGAIAQLSYSTAAVDKAVIPSTRLIPATEPDRSKGYNLLEKFKPKANLEAGYYGFNKTPLVPPPDTTWKASTNRLRWDEENPDVRFEYGQPSPTTNFEHSLDLPILSEDAIGWSLTGFIDFTGNNLSLTEGGQYVKLIDASGKVIVRMTPSLNKDDSSIDFNSLKIFRGTQAEVIAIANKRQPIEVRSSESGIVVKYADFAAFTIPPFDITSDSKNPEKLHINYWTTASNRNVGRAVAFDTLYFKEFLLPPDVEEPEEPPVDPPVDPNKKVALRGRRYRII